MEIQINIEDYMDKDAIGDLIRDELHRAVKKDAERILGNTAYSVVWEAVDKALDNEAKQIVQRNVLRVLDNITEFSVFRRKGSYEEKASTAQIELDKAVDIHKDIIDTKVREAMENFDYKKLIDVQIGDYFVETLVDVIKKGLQNDKR